MGDLSDHPLGGLVVDAENLDMAIAAALKRDRGELERWLPDEDGDDLFILPFPNSETTDRLRRRPFDQREDFRSQLLVGVEALKRARFERQTMSPHSLERNQNIPSGPAACRPACQFVTQRLASSTF